MAREPSAQSPMQFAVYFALSVYSAFMLLHHISIDSYLLFASLIFQRINSCNKQILIHNEKIFKDQGMVSLSAIAHVH
jgi:hypothetical protein